MKTSRQQAQTQKAAALGSWEGEGGTVGPARLEERQVIELLGGAVLASWARLPAEVQGMLLDSLPLTDALQAEQIRGQVAVHLQARHAHLNAPADSRSAH